MSSHPPALRVLQAPIEVSGQVTLSARGLRAHGCEVRTLFPATGARTGSDVPADITLASRPVAARLLDGARRAVQVAGRYDVFHYHYGASLLPRPLRYADARLNRRLRSRVVVEFWGDDVRLPSVESARNPHYTNGYEARDDVNRRRIAEWADVTQGHAIVADHFSHVALASHFPHLHVVGQRVDTERLRPLFPSPETREPVIVHAPTEHASKGTRFVRQAIERLKARGLRMHYREVHGVTHSEALAIYASSDIIVDQLCTGSHGVFAAEAMALGKPVVCYVLPELVDTYPDGFPIINASPLTIEQVLEEWIQRPEDRHSLGRASRSYAERVHDYRSVATRLLNAYRQLPL